MFPVITAWTAAVALGWSTWARIPLVAAVAGAAVIAVALSPLGRRSGAHLNPAVTLGLWLQRVMSHADLAGYTTAQFFGALLGFSAGRMWGPSVAGPAVHWAGIAPGPSVPTAAALVLEAAATAAQLAVVFLLLTSERWHGLTAVAAGILLTIGIVALATTSGAGFSPVRGLAPDLLRRAFPGLWVYLTAPLVGAAVAALAPAARGRLPLTGKLRHDPAVRCVMRCALPHAPAPDSPPPLEPKASAQADRCQTQF